MSAAALALILASAVLHASWNVMVKRAGASGAAFTWLFTVPSVILLGPVTAWMFAKGQFRVDAWTALLLAVSAVIHTAAFLLLQRGYRVGDLSVVYPLSRGTGPLLATLGAVIILRERPSVAAIIGALSIAAGAATLAFEQSPHTGAVARWASLRYGLAIGTLMAAYTIWDKYLVGALTIPPIALECVLSAGIALIVTPAVVRDRGSLSATWKAHKVVAVSGALISSASYILFLTALRVAPVSRAAPLRETSILLGALFGARLLGEGHTGRRMAAALAITVGVILLARG